MKLILLYSFLFICISPTLLSVVVNGESNPEKASVTERFKQIALELGKSSQDSWGKFKSIVYRVQEKVFPPSLDFRRTDGLSSMESDGASATTGMVKDAVGKSLETSNSVLEDTADTMSDMVGDAVQKTTEKVKETISDKDEASNEKKDEL